MMDPTELKGWNTQGANNLSAEGQALLKELMAGMVTKLHAGQTNTPTGEILLEVYVNHFFPDGNIPSKEAMYAKIRPEFDKIQTIGETLFQEAAADGVIRGPQ